MRNEPESFRFFPRRLSGNLSFWPVTLAALMLVLISAAVKRPERITLEPGSRILLADIQNLTADTQQGPPLRQLLGLALDQSPYFNLLPDSAVRESLQFLARDSRSPLTSGLALQICGRERIPVFLLPALTRAGHSFILSVKLIEVSGNRIVREVLGDAVRAESETELLYAVENVARKLRVALGEMQSSPAMAGSLFFPVSRNSDKALRIFAQARLLGAQKNDAGEIALLEQAVGLDPNFTLAHARLASLYARQGRAEKASAHIEDARGFSDHLPPKEKHRTRAAWYALKQDYTGALRELEVLSAIYPRDWETRSEMGEIALQMCDFSRAVKEFQNAVLLNDSRFESQVGLCVAEMFNGRPLEARKALEQAQALDPEHPRVIFAGAQLDLIDSNVASAVRALQKATAGSQTAVRSHLSYLLAQANIYGGRIRAAFELLDQGIEEDRRQGDAASEILKRLAKAQMQLLLGNAAQALGECRQIALSAKSPSATLAYIGSVFAQAGSPSEAQAVLKQLEQRPETAVTVGHVETLRGEIALIFGRTGEAIQTLLRAKAARPNNPPSEALARALMQAGRREEALKEYREISERKAEILFPADSPWFTGTWVRALFDAGRGLLQTGSKREAQQYLRNYLWALDGADPSIPTVQEARQLLRGK